MYKVSLQINLAPSDYLLVRETLKHQLKILSAQVDEILLVVESKPSKGRFSAGWETYKEKLAEFLRQEIQPNKLVRVISVDYSLNTKKDVARYFFGLDTMPDKDCRGGPFYAYFFGLMFASNQLVFHLDADMFLGGGSQHWVSEAADCIKNHDGCFTVSPLPGPPHPEDILIRQSVRAKLAPYRYSLNGMSTRIFMINRSVFEQYKLKLRKPGFRDQIRAIFNGHPNADLPENIISAYMDEHSFSRIDFLGSGKGLWSLHPPYRTKSFFDNLPQIINCIEDGDLPYTQNGFYDIVDEVCDWSEARERLKNKRWWRRFK
ncbi:hypothetical protein [Mucilaginibacter flavus]|uniref:hypothetical protein n=1 Tax=Mucilaginibacter flavus TaxID=931504 RepID=UPI0025B4100F|nr:hypothetical protein [Mucilaginibacter flavus]MDN3584424.1 hypothetical protein [Mucilaginibacter flavus]